MKQQFKLQTRVSEVTLWFDIIFHYPTTYNLPFMVRSNFPGNQLRLLRKFIRLKSHGYKTGNRGQVNTINSSISSLPVSTQGTIRSHMVTNMS